ncbi:MAG: endonuclease III [Sedimentisphaerales bacterium]|nr:endonuclease III [Sedimentisphaerales bacterium]
MSAKTKKAKPKVSKTEATKRVGKILPILKKQYPDAKTELEYGTPLQLLICTILSAQCTDVRVNEVSRELFKKYENAEDFANADLTGLELDIKSTGFFRNKAKNIKAACQVIIDKYAKKVPGTIHELTSLPGVGRKTANVILSNAFGIPAISCDTHVIRLSRRLALSDNDDPVKLEFDLAEIVPQKDWSVFSHTIILHGRRVCKARKPDCENCLISEFCPSANRPDFW